MKAHMFNLLLGLSAGAVLMLAAPAYAESPQAGKTEVRIAKSAINKSAIKLRHLRYTAPHYPAAALQARISGFVVIEYVVNAKGEPTGLRVVDAQPVEIFERSVLKAAKRWRFSPLVIDNVARDTPSRTIVRFDMLS